jgi:hypothetical protein
VYRGTKASKDSRVSWAPQGLRAIKAPKDSKAWSVLRVPWERRATKETRASKVPKDSKVWWVQPALKVTKATRDFRV